MSGSRWSSVGVVVAIAGALFTGSCSSGGGGAGVGKASKDGGADATVGCVTDADCATSVPSTRPAPGVGANCAAGKCNALQGVCEYVAKDEDGDGHAAANCTSTNGVPIQEGDDCNDEDPNLYPGHPETCTPTPDGGADSGAFCTTGQILCLADGMESACSGSCAPCKPNVYGCQGTQPRQCNMFGTAWSTVGVDCAGVTATPACLAGTCVACNPTAVQCSGDGPVPAQPQICDSTGAWVNNGNACDATHTCVNGTCTGVCAAGQWQCSSSTQAQTCLPDGAWQNAGDPCVDQTCVVGPTGDAGAACQGVCVVGQTQCAGNAVQTCDATGSWSTGVDCAPPTPACVDGACFPCSQGATQCATSTGWQVCTSSNQWGSAAPCPSTSTCVGIACETSTAPSCQVTGNGLTDCGGGSESCCTSIEVPGGVFYRTYANSGTEPTGEANPATVSAFRLDKYSVTVGRFRQFVAAWNGGWLPAGGSGVHTYLNGGQGLVNGPSTVDGGPVAYETGWQTGDNGAVAPTDANLICDSAYATWTASAGYDIVPMNCVNWYEAYAFCIWDGGFLPSVAEWEYVAAGGAQQREYPWGSTTPGTNALYADYGCYFGPPGGCVGSVNITAVGKYTAGAGLWGHLDMAGDVEQLTMDWIYSPVPNPCVDCATLTPIPSQYGQYNYRLYKGSYYGSPASDLYPTHASDQVPAMRAPQVGFRCARGP